MTTSWDEELRFAHRLADIADGITLPAFEARIEARIKADGTPVTDADEGAEHAMRAAIEKSYPGHAIVGEEEGTIGSSEKRWILDPIDGTMNFAAGIPIWGTLIALEVSGEVVCGVASAPALRERYAAVRGAGATLNGERIRVSDHPRLEGARVVYTSFRSFARAGFGDGFQKLISESSWSRSFGDFWGHMLVASGRADVMTEPVVNVWDLAPLLVIVEEAGGRFTDLQGRRTASGGSALSTNGVLHEAALAVIRGPSAKM